MLDDIPTITYTGADIPGRSVINVALIGTETQLKKIMIAAKWYPADPLTLVQLSWRSPKRPCSSGRMTTPGGEQFALLRHARRRLGV